MSLKVHTRFPGSNVRVLQIVDTDAAAEIQFAADPHGGPESLWFCFRVVSDSAAGHPEKLTLTLRFFDTLPGGSDPDACRPVYQPDGQQWFRAAGGHPQRRPDGRLDVSWTLPYPAPGTLVALCYPYGPEDVDRLVRKCMGFWKTDVIGLSQGGRTIDRLSNDYGSNSGKAPGVYIVARQHSGETPGSWVLDGILDRLSREKKQPFVAWVVPFANVDGVERGDYGKDNFPYDLNRAWGQPPMRHETLAIRHDMHAWHSRCTPKLALDLHAPGCAESSGIYACVPDAEAHPAAHRDSASWARTFEQELGEEAYAAPKFIRTGNYRSRWETPRFGDFVRDELKIPALTLEVPYALCGKTVMTQKAYRDAGRLIGKGLLQRLRG